MSNDRFQLFKLMICVLAEIWKESPNDGLGSYLDEANPFCVEEGSFDPAVYEDFKESYNKWKNSFDDYGYNFICNYLKKLDSYYGDIYGLFSRLSKEAYLVLAKEIVAKEDTDLIDRYFK